MLVFVAAMNLLYVVLIFSSFASLQPLLAAAISAVLLAIQAQEMTVIISIVIDHCPLELLHLPTWWRVNTAMLQPKAARALVCEWNGPAHRAAATTRAAYLRKCAGIRAPGAPVVVADGEAFESTALGLSPPRSGVRIGPAIAEK